MQVIPVEQIFGLTDQHIVWLSPHIGLHHAVLTSFKAMQTAALQDGIEITIASGFRSFDRQAILWNNKAAGLTPVKDINNHPIASESLSKPALLEAILLYSAFPGTSRHHWGCDVDVYSKSQLAPEQTLALEPWEYQQGGPFYALSQWLNAHAQQFGFYLPYKQYQGGVANEPWHLSYQPLAHTYQQHLTPEALIAVIEDKNILLKAEMIANIDQYFKNYIFNLCEPE